jgi:hypothetical protein
MTEFLLASAAVAVALVLARRGVLHPGDYLVAAGLAVLLAVSVVGLAPTALDHRLLLERGAPPTAIARSEFLLRHGVWIELASIAAAVGAVIAAVVRARRPYLNA